MVKPDVFIFLVFLYVGCIVHRNESVGFHGALDIIQVAKEVVVVISKSWKVVDQHVDFGDIPIPLLGRTEEKLFGKIGVINAKLDEIAQKIENTGKYSGY